jgi:hypothetical protein
MVTLLTTLTLGITGTVETIEMSRDLTTPEAEMEILGAIDTKIGTRVDETEIVEEDTVDAVDADEAVIRRFKATIFVQFMVDISGKIVILTQMGTITGPGTAQEMETARAEEMARGQTTPTTQIKTLHEIMVAPRRKVKEMAQIPAIPETPQAENAVTRKTQIITWPTWEPPIGLSID